MKKSVIPIAIFISLLADITPAFAVVSDLIPIGGILTDLDGVPLDGPVQIALALYDAETGGSKLWSDELEIQVDAGAFTAYLGDNEPLDLLDIVGAEELWLGITVGSDSEAERILLAAVPYAIEAQYCHEVIGVKCDEAEYLQGWDPDAGTPICTPLSFADLSDVPAELDDGDNDTQYTAGAGLALTGTEFSAVQSDIEDWAMGVCYDNEAELIADLDDDYVNEGQTGSVTDDMLTGDISPEKITGTAWTSGNDGPLSGLNADLVDGQHADAFALAGHTHDGNYQAVYKRTVVVSPAGDGSDTASNGDTLLAALAGITDASAANPYLLKIEPGIYKLQESDGSHKSLVMKPYVDIEGSGERVTKITTVGSSSFSGTIWGTDNSELRFLTAENTGGPSLTYAIAIYNYMSSPSILHVTANASDSDQTRTIFNSSASPSFTHVKAHGSCGVRCYGIRDYLSNSSFDNVSASAYADSGGYAVGIRIIGAIDTIHLDNLKASASSSNDSPSYASWIENSSVVISNSLISAQGGSYLRGITTSTAFELTVINSRIEAFSETSTDCFAIRTATGTACPAGSCVLKVINSTLASSVVTVLVDADYVSSFAGSLLSGDAMTVNGTAKCFGVFDDSFDACGSDCVCP